MFGLIGSMTTTSGDRAAVAEILLESIGQLPGCLSYVVAEDPGDPDRLWITEVWTDEDSHQSSLQLPAVQDAIARARPLLAGFGDQQRTHPVGGHGLVGD